MDQTVSMPEPSRETVAPSRLLIWTRRFVCLSLSVAGGLIILQLGTRLVIDLRSLSRELATARDREPMGYLGISADQPEVKPPACVVEENGRVLLWAGSSPHGQAGWFDASATDLPLRQFRYAFGRDRIKTIDYPILQGPDGEIVRRIYPERRVLGLVAGGVARAYPLTVMDKVEVVNDTLGNRNLAVTFCPLIQQPAVYERTMNGQLIGLGTSGYCYKEVFVLYDRGTDSLWYPHEEGLKAITGPLVGEVLPLAAEQAELVTWGEWRGRHPDTEVVVGADRSRGIPLLPAGQVATRAM